MFSSKPNSRAFYLNTFLANNGYNDAWTKLLTEECSVSIRLIKVLKMCSVNF